MGKPPRGGKHTRSVMSYRGRLSQRKYVCVAELLSHADYHQSISSSKWAPKGTALTRDFFSKRAVVLAQRPWAGFTRAWFAWSLSLTHTAHTRSRTQRTHAPTKLADHYLDRRSAAKVGCLVIKQLNNRVDVTKVGNESKQASCLGLARWTRSEDDSGYFPSR